MSSKNFWASVNEELHQTVEQLQEKLLDIHYVLINVEISTNDLCVCDNYFRVLN